MVDPRPEPGVDRESVRACLSGNQDACTALVETYVRMVGTVIWRATGRRDVIEDLTQETFLRTFKALEYYDARARLSTWIYTIAHNVAIDHLRRMSSERVDSLIWRLDDRKDEPEERQFESGAPDPEAQLARAESERLVREGLSRLPVKYRVPVMYAAIDGLDYPTIASMLNVPLGTVKTLIFRGKRLLKDDIARRLGTPHDT